MFEFIKSLFRRKRAEETSAESRCPFLGHSTYTEDEEVDTVTPVKPTVTKPTVTKPKVAKLPVVNATDNVIDVTPAIAKGVKPADTKKSKPKAKQVKSEPAKIVQLVQPLPTKKKGRPKKNTIDKQS